MANSYGWAIDLAITKIGESRQHIIAINLSLLGGADEADGAYWLGKDDFEEKIAFESWNSKGIFLPWSWENLQWKLFKKNNNDSWVLVREVLSINKVNPNPSLISAVENSLTKLPKESWKPFDAKNIQKNSTLLHSLAPLGYLPSDISSSINLSFSATFDDSLEAGEYAVFPTFNFEYKTPDYKPANCETSLIRKLGDYARCQYSQNEGLDFNIIFYCNIESHISNTIDWSTLSLEEVGLKNQTQIRLNLLNFLSPIAIFKQFANKLVSSNQVKDNIELIYTYLIRSIGAGWDFSYHENRLGNINKKSIIYENLLKVFSRNDFTISVGSFVGEKPVFDINVDNLLSFDFDQNLKDLKDFLLFYQKINEEHNEKIKEEYKNQFIKLLPKILNLLNDSKTFNQITIIFWLIHNKVDKAFIKNLFNQICSQEVLQTVIDKAMYVSIFEPIWFKKDENIIKLCNLITDRELYEDEILAMKNHLLLGFDGVNKTEVTIKEIEEVICNQIFSFSKETYDREPEPTPYDSGLKFKFASYTGTQDELFRGYAIGLQVGYLYSDKITTKFKRSSWITNVQLLINQKIKFSDQFLHETIGATQVDSQTVGYFEFTGNPILASRWGKNAEDVDDFVNKSEIVDADGTDYLDYIWPEEDYKKSFPLLGYGLCYRGIAVPLGNAGEIFDDKVKSELTKLKSASDAINNINSKEVIRYLSQVAPGSPTVVNAYELIALQELSSETKAYAFQSQEIKSQGKISQIQPVALLTSDTDTFIETHIKSEITLHILPPIPSFDFYEKWLNADLISSEEEDVDNTYIKLMDFKNNLKKANKLKEKLKKLYKTNLYAHDIKDDLLILRKLHESLSIHPAVKKIIIRVKFNEEAYQPDESFDVSSNIKYSIKVLKSGSNTIPKKANERELIINLKSGSFCKVELYSAVSEKYFTEEVHKRFESELFKDNQVLKIGKEQYRLFGSTEYWLEAAPNSVSNVEKIDLEIKDKISFVELSIANANQIDATWIRGVEFQRHEWHWTGYPVTFPTVKSEFDKWLSSFVGVESYRLKDNYVLNSYIDGNSWNIGDKDSQSAVVHQHQLASGPRPAKYIAFSVRPKIRFSKWIKADIRKEFESKIFANGVLAKGIPIDVLQERIPVPPLKWAIPLTATYKKPEDFNAQQPDRTQNGNLLIFDEAFRRTDSLVRFGGIGDTIDIEVMGTRIKEIHEFGVNPIFHGYEKLDDQTLLCDEPFGLTYDITRNAKVAQTGIVVRPKITEGKWMLAKVRARRLIHPDTIESKALEEINAGIYKLPLRKIGDQVIPADFSLKEKIINLQILGKTIYISDGNSESSLFVTFSNLTKTVFTENESDKAKIVTKYSLEISTVSEKNPATLSGSLARINKHIIKIKDIDEAEYLENPGYIEVGIKTDKDNSSQPSLLQISDYTEPLWLSFIGSFSVDATKLSSDKCKIFKNIDNSLTFKSEIILKDSNGKPIMLEETFSSPSDKTSNFFQALLVYEPVQDIYKTGKELDGGRFKGFYVVKSEDNKSTFVKTADSVSATILGDASAYLITFQKASAMSDEDEMKFSNTSSLKLMNLLFPDQYAGKDGKRMEKPKESIIRIVPQYMEPIKIMRK